MIIIKSIHIKNFRSIVDETIELKDFNCFVGKNDSGKSNVLKALNLFFNGETDYDSKLNFDEDYSQFAKRGQKQAREILIELEIVVPESFKESGIKKWKKVWRKDGIHKDNTSDLFSQGSRGLTYLSRMTYFYIPAVKSTEHFKGLLSRVYSSMTQAADGELKHLNEEYSISLQKLTGNLTTQIGSLLGLKSAIQMPSNLNVLFRDLTFSTSDDNARAIDLNHRGDGVKARHIPPILRFIQQNTEKSRPKGSVYGSYIWGFEEPENGVEYLSCFEMANEFFSYISDCQMLITTHSPAFYTISTGDKSVCFQTVKQNGCSKYLISKNEIINESMGLMQIVAPFIEAARNEYIEGQDTAYHNLIIQLKKVMNIMKRSSEKLDVQQILDVLDQYSAALDMLDDYDHQRLEKPDGTDAVYVLSYEECRELIDKMKFSAESELFGNEKDDSFKGSIGNIYQSFGGVELYPSVEEKAANLLYFITKNHSFSDGNKRIAAAIFLYFLEKNDLMLINGEKTISDHTLVAIIVMVAESRPEEKETMIKLIMNFLKH